MAGKKYTLEQKEWLQNSAIQYGNLIEVTKVFNDIFQENRTTQAILSQLKYYRVFLRNYPKKQVEWLFKNFNRYENNICFTRAFNEKFNDNKTVAAISQQCEKLGLNRKNKWHTYTNEEKRWIYDNVKQDVTWDYLHQSFNKIFKTDITRKNFIRCCLEIIGDIKGQPPAPNKKEVGELSERGGYLYIKYREPKSNEKIEYDRCWKPLARYIYEKQYGELSNDYLVIFLDSNKRNFDIENLYAVAKKYIPYMRHNEWFSNNPEETLTAIKWCELIYELQKQ